MNNKYTAVVLAFMVLAAEANTINARVSHSQLEKYAQKWDGLGITADVNDYVDNTISMLVPFIQTHGLDPMELPDIVEGFQVRPILITYSAWLKIQNGRMTGLVNLARSGDQNVSYFAKMVRMRIELQISDLSFNYNYLVKVMNIGPTGGIIGSLDRITTVVDILLDFNNDEIQLQQFSLNHGNLRVRLTGNLLTDWLITPVINVFMRIFDDIIIKVVEVTIKSAVQDAIDFINANVKEVLTSLETFN